jgi:hypothetical protein
MNKEIFRTLVPVSKAPELMTPEDGVLFMGSCFAGNMGKYMSDARFSVLINPFGVLYNPISIADAFTAFIENSTPAKEELFFHNELWHSFSHHGQFSHPNPIEVIEKIQDSTSKGHNFLKKARFLVITFGTSYVYEHKKMQRVVANCHKFPDSDFSRYRLEPEEIIEAYKDLIIKLRVFNPDLNIVFTVSPIRHMKDGAHGNQVSKSVLLLAVEKLTALFEKVWYFPAYEIVLDELRDYRFYDEAMTHPNDIAVKYIWNKFMEATFSHESQNYYKEVQKVIRARNHQPSVHNTDQAHLFFQNSLDLVDSLSDQYPHVNLHGDREYFKKMLSTY